MPVALIAFQKMEWIVNQSTLHNAISQMVINARLMIKIVK